MLPARGFLRLYYLRSVCPACFARGRNTEGVGLFPLAVVFQHGGYIRHIGKKNKNAVDFFDEFIYSGN